MCKENKKHIHILNHKGTFLKEGYTMQWLPWNNILGYAHFYKICAIMLQVNINSRTVCDKAPGDFMRNK